MVGNLGNAILVALLTSINGAPFDSLLVGDSETKELPDGFLPKSTRKMPNIVPSYRIFLRVERGMRLWRYFDGGLSGGRGALKEVGHGWGSMHTLFVCSRNTYPMSQNVSSVT